MVLDCMPPGLLCNYIRIYIKIDYANLFCFLARCVHIQLAIIHFDIFVEFSINNCVGEKGPASTLYMTPYGTSSVLKWFSNGPYPPIYLQGIVPC